MPMSYFVKMRRKILMFAVVLAKRPIGMTRLCGVASAWRRDCPRFG